VSRFRSIQAKDSHALELQSVILAIHVPLPLCAVILHPAMQQRPGLHYSALRCPDCPSPPPVAFFQRPGWLAVSYQQICTASVPECALGWKGTERGTEVRSACPELNPHGYGCAGVWRRVRLFGECSDRRGRWERHMAKERACKLPLYP